MNNEEPATDSRCDRSPGTAWGDTIIYETHVRGITRLHPSIPEHERGTYAGLTHPAVLEHLTTLGVTAVELLPVHHFLDETHHTDSGLSNYWGYSTIGYFAPHSEYAATGSGGEQASRPVLGKDEKRRSGGVFRRSPRGECRIGRRAPRR